jgi:signal transduction histidine kinase
LTTEAPRDAEAFPEGPADPSEHLARAQRVLAHLRNALSHDVSNQLVAVQGLLQLLRMEESDRLSAYGKDYVQRATDAAGRAQGLLATLKELARLGAEKVAPVEAISLDGLVRDLAVEVKAQHPDWALECRLAPDAVRVRAPGRLLHQALQRLVRAVLGAGSGAARKAGIRSRRVVGGVELTVAEVPPEGRPGPAPPRRESDGPPWTGDRHDWALVRELVEACGGSVAAWTEPGCRGLVTLVIPAAG